MWGSALRGSRNDRRRVRARTRPRTGGPHRNRALAVVLALLATQLVALAWPAYACGCGGMLTERGNQIHVDRETSAVRWDGRTEEILMRLQVGGDAERAAWVMPVPNRATVRLGDRKIFDDLDEIVQPVTEKRHYFWPRAGDWPLSEPEVDGAAPPRKDAGASAPPVGVVGRDRLGPFDVVRLTATDPDALRNWLNSNGFPLPRRMATELKPYVEKKWEYVAARLAPKKEAGGGDGSGEQGSPSGSPGPNTPPGPSTSAGPSTSPGPSGSPGPGGGPGGQRSGPVLSGALDPLHLTFRSSEFVYPMRLSRAARTPQYLRMYVFGAHRTEPRGAIGGREPEMLYAGRLTGGSGLEGPVRKFADGRNYLTAFAQDFPEPHRISGDHHLRRTATDEAFRQVRYDDELLAWGGVPAWLISVGVPFVAAVLVAALLVLRAVRRRRAARMVPPEPPFIPPPLR